MSRYSISDEDLRGLIEEASASWLPAARARTKVLDDSGRYHDDWKDEEIKVSWGDIKSVYRTLQGDKCGYCERPLAASGKNTPEIGGSEHDVEHYRPKAKVTTWGRRKHAPAPAFDFAWNNEARSGYYWLAYDPWNYCTACKVCNTELKGNRFPIRGPAGDSTMDRRALDAQERPLLLFPLGHIDEDPQEHIEFNGITPVAVARSVRGRATIEFFLLDRRDDLERGRTDALLIAWNWIGRELDASDAEQAARRAETDRLAARPGLLHANFVRSLVRLARTKPDHARQLHAAAMMDLAGVTGRGG